MAKPSQAERGPGPKRSGAPRARTTLPEWAWPILSSLGIIALLWSCRGAPLGTPIADDYAFLFRLTFQHPLDPFDSMGATYYWRPLSRQVYFSMIGPRLFQAPWLAAAINVVLLLLISLVLYRALRSRLSAPLAAVIAAFPLLCEPARALLTWPSGAQHLLAGAAAAIALHEALAGRVVSAAVATWAGVLSHESALLMLPTLPVVAWFRTHRKSEVMKWAAVTAGIALLWAVGYGVALRHGIHLPVRKGGGFPFDLVPGLLARALNAALNVEDLDPGTRQSLMVGTALLIGIALVLAARRTVRARITSHAPAFLGGLGWFVVGSLPLAVLLPDWNAWRAWLPSLGLGVAVTAFLGLASPWLAAGFVGLRLAGLLLAPVALPVVTPFPPESASHMSFERLVRLQRTVDSARRALLSRYPELPRGAAVRFWTIPRMAEVGFQDSLAVRTWYRDTALSWGTFGGAAGFNKHIDAMLEFIDNEPAPATVVEANALQAFQQAGLAMQAGRSAEADSLLDVAARGHHSDQGPFLAAIIMNHAFVAYHGGNYHQADSLSRKALALGGQSADAWALVAELATMRNDRDAAITAVRQCLRIDPSNAAGRRLAAVWKLLPASQ